MLSFREFREQEDSLPGDRKISVTIVVEGAKELWMAKLAEVDGRPPDERFLGEMGLSTSAMGRYGWEALANLATHMKNAGFLD